MAVTFFEGWFVELPPLHFTGVEDAETKERAMSGRRQVSQSNKGGGHRGSHCSSRCLYLNCNYRVRHMHKINLGPQTGLAYAAASRRLLNVDVGEQTHPSRPAF